MILARHGVGLDFVDLEACTRRGIGVTITPQGITRPMASAAVTLVLALAPPPAGARPGAARGRLGPQGASSRRASVSRGGRSA